MVQGTLKVGLQEGVASNDCTPADKLIKPYDIKKNMETTGAMALRLPICNAPKAMIAVMISATLGFLSDLDSLLKNRGRISSLARACSVLGAPSNPPSALERVAPQMLNRTR